MKGEKVKSKAGFTLTELAVVVAILMVVAGLSLPSISRTLDNAKLTSAAQQLASMYQGGRIRATQDNNYYVLPVFTNVQGSAICLDLDGDGACSAAEPQAQMPLGVSLDNRAIPVELNQTTLGFIATSGITKTETSINYGSQGTLEPGLAWNALGLPCARASSISPCRGPLAWVQYLQLTRGGDVLYAAVTVSPTGNVRIWHYSGGVGAGSWF